jgi:hypothetical protein
MYWLKLTSAHANRPTYVNMALVTEIMESVSGNHTCLYIAASDGESQTRTAVTETPEEIMRMLPAQ